METRDNGGSSGVDCGTDGSNMVVVIILESSTVWRHAMMTVRLVLSIVKDGSNGLFRYLGAHACMETRDTDCPYGGDYSRDGSNIVAVIVLEIVV